LKRQKEDIKAYKKENKTKIPTNFDYNEVKGIIK
jgi:tRNA U34 5-carboxymethylaminomethyl modifying enzyme MnmG/GidA